jgi:hypothetical protein
MHDVRSRDRGGLKCVVLIAAQQTFALRQFSRRALVAAGAAQRLDIPVRQTPDHDELHALTQHDHVGPSVGQFSQYDSCLARRDGFRIFKVGDSHLKLFRRFR